MQAADTAGEQKVDLVLEIAHILLIDIVGYSKLLVNEQVEALQSLNRVVRSASIFRAAEAQKKLTRVPTGDGMALIFSDNPETPVRCAIEVASAAQTAGLRLRMGIHSGPVNRVQDVNDNANVAGTGINVAQRVMDCGDAGHILLSKHVADDLAQYRHWLPLLHDLGECEVKHGRRLHIFNLQDDAVGNPARPDKLCGSRHRQRVAAQRAHPHPIPARWKVALPVLGAAVIAAVAVLSLRLVAFKHPTLPADKSVAVLPFANWSDAEGDQHFSAGIHDEILTNLSKVADLKVISRTSVMQYGEKTQRNLRDIAKSLGVAYIVEGSVQTINGRVRVNTQLIEAKTDAHLWAAKFDGDLGDVFGLEDKIAVQIVAALKIRLSPQEKADIEQAPTRDLVAYDLYSRARSLLATSGMTRGRENRFEAARLLQQAIDRDDGFFAAQYELARVHDQIYLLGFDRTDARVAAAEACIAAARRLRPDSGMTHLAVAGHLYCVYLDYDKALAEVAAAERSLHNEPGVFELAAYIDRRQGRFDDAARKLRRALELDPRSVYYLQQLALGLEKQRRFAEMAEVLDRAIAILPGDAGLRWNRAAVEVEWRANPEPARALLASMGPTAVAELASDIINFSVMTHDLQAGDRAIAAMDANGGSEDSLLFPRAWYVGLVASARGDVPAARSAFAEARVEAEQQVRNHPQFAPPLSVLAQIEAMLGQAVEARAHARRAVEMLPLEKDHVVGATLREALARTDALLGDRDSAFAELTDLSSIPGNINYGTLRLQPFWEKLRADPRFETLLARFAPH